LLKNIPAILSPDLLYTLRAMGHGDEIAIVDANFPAEYLGPEVIRADGSSATDILNAVLALLPLDDFVEDAAIAMAVVGDPTAKPPIFGEFEALIATHEPTAKFSTIERFAFYDRARGASAVVQTGERRLYGNIILKKGVIRQS
jgi:L-fucose mutarotase